MPEVGIKEHFYYYFQKTLMAIILHIFSLNRMKTFLCLTFHILFFLCQQNSLFTYKIVRMYCSYIFFTTLRHHIERVFTYGHLVLLVDSISIPLPSHLAGEGGGRAPWGFYYNEKCLGMTGSYIRAPSRVNRHNTLLHPAKIGEKV